MCKIRIADWLLWIVSTEIIFYDQSTEPLLCYGTGRYVLVPYQVGNVGRNLKSWLATLSGGALRDFDTDTRTLHVQCTRSCRNSKPVVRSLTLCQS